MHVLCSSFLPTTPKGNPWVFGKHIFLTQTHTSPHLNGSSETQPEESSPALLISPAGSLSRHAHSLGLGPSLLSVCPGMGGTPLACGSGRAAAGPPPTLSLCRMSGLQDLSYKDRHWHEACFHCSRCKSSLVDKPFAAKEEQLLCTDCYSHEYSSKCQECKKTIMPGQEWPFSLTMCLSSLPLAELVLGGLFSKWHCAPLRTRSWAGSRALME